MIVPVLRAWIEQRHGFTADRIQANNVVQLGTVADRTSKGQVVRRCWAASADGMNVVEFKATDLKPAGQQTVFAPFTGSLNDGVAQ